MERKLIRKLYRFDCPPNILLGEYQLGLLDGPTVVQVKNHLSRCDLCRAEVISLTGFMAQGPLPVELSPVEAQSTATVYDRQPVQAARRVWERVQDQAQEGVRRVIASLLPPQPRAIYLRNPTQQGAEWPRRYEGEDVSISLQLEQSPGRDDTLQLIGLIKRDGMALEALVGIPVQLASSPQVTYTQQVDDLGNFIFAALTPATYTLEVRFPDKVVAIEQLVITAQE
jgi:hypothetical protein